MTVALPLNGIVDASPYFIDMGGVMAAELGGEDQRLNRMGSRWGASFKIKPMKGEAARVWIARLIRGVHEKASIKFPQPGVLFPTTSTTIAVAAIANASVIQFGAGTYREGQFFSVIHAGKNYLYQIKGDGAALVEVQPSLRSALSIADAVQLQNAQIEGYVKGNQHEWNIDRARIYGLDFVIEEAA